MDLQQNYLSFEPLESFKELLTSTKDSKLLKDLFSETVTFGTAGLRGIMKPGLSGINGFTIGQASYALAKYLKTLHPHKPLVICISYDNRHHSLQFAEIAARIFAHEGITVKLAAKMRPTPWLSFAIKEMKADAGVMITASHNPKIYNGFKVYLSDGGQIVSPHDKAIMEIMKTTHAFYLANSHDPHIELIDQLIDHKYMHMLLNRLKKEPHADLKIVYSPLCGTGFYIIPEALKTLGFHNLYFVQEEMQPDPEFAGIPTPNPETAIALKRSLDLLEKEKADIALISDPDADRLGLAIRHQNHVVSFTGNEIACLILDYLIQTTQKLDDKVVVSSFVTTHLLKKMCQAHNMTHIETLTGFKYIGQVIDALESKNQADRFLLGAEESYGYLVGTHARDKDAIIISTLLAKAAQACKLKRQTLWDRLLEIYQTYGVYVEETYTLEFPVGTPQSLILDKLKPLIANPPKTILGAKVTKIINYQTQEIISSQNDKQSSQLPKADALGLFSDHGWIIVRPSGTEPKLKIYGGLTFKAESDIAKQKHTMMNSLKSFLKDFSHHDLG